MGSGAMVMKHPIELHEMFEEIEGVKIRGHYKSKDSE